MTGTIISIGMPVYNGEKDIHYALISLLSQTYTDFELIISDNASTDRTWKIISAYARKDPRIRCVRQKRNLGPIKNFNTVLEMATGEYFMWAAHDDSWDSRFIEEILHEFSKSPKSIAAIGCEAQYTIKKRNQLFFPEGQRFYNPLRGLKYQRIKYVLKYGYGNLFYSIFRRECLFNKNRAVFSDLKQISLNEIPLFIKVSEKGSWKILPKILFFKETNLHTYERAKWEMIGGPYRYLTLKSYLGSISLGFIYHVKTLIDILRCLEIIDLGRDDKRKLKVYGACYLMMHYFQLFSQYKKVKASHDE